MAYKTFLLLLFLILSFNSLSAQKANLISIRKEIEAKYSIDFDTVDLCDTYILDGVPYNSETIIDELKRYKPKQVIITALADLSNTTFTHRNCSSIILLGTYSKQSNKEKTELLEEVKENLNNNLPDLNIKDFSCEKCKAVMIDSKIYDMYEAKEIINHIKTKDIYYITFYKNANPAYYGENAKNGLVEIFLNDKLIK